MKGTVLFAAQSLNMYVVSVDGALVAATYFGSGRGRLGANEGGGFIIGQQVWVAINPQMPTGDSVILGSVEVPFPASYPVVKRLIEYPQVAGFEYSLQTNRNKSGKLVTTAIPKRALAEIYAALTKIKNYPTGVQDSVDGDWLVTNMFGGGVGVEAFRSYIKGGPLSGLTFFSDEDLARLYAESLEIKTLAREYEDRRVGASMVEIDRRVFYPNDAIYETQPQELAVSGPLYGGRQKFFSYRIKDNLPDEAKSSKEKAEDAARDTGRFGLLHEYRGSDGSYTLSSASTIILQKFVGVKVPIEVLPADPDVQTGKLSKFPGVVPRPDNKDSLTDFELPSAQIVSKPVDSPQKIHDTLTDMRVHEQPTSIADVIDAVGLAKKIIDWQARGGFDRLEEQWKVSEDQPSYLWSTEQEREDNEVEPAEEYFSVCPSMWKLPRSFEISLDSYGAKKTFYLGRAVIAMMPDGGIVLQEAGGAQIVLSGGNVFINAPHDIITAAGRNRVEFAGRDMSTRAGRHYEVLANEGHVVMTASAQFTLVGGLDGYSGVLIESKGEGSNLTEGELPFNAGGVLIKGSRYVGVTANDITVRATGKGWNGGKEGGIMQISAQNALAIDAKEKETKLLIGSEIMGKTTQLPGFVIGKNTTFGHLTCTGTFFHDDLVHQRDFTFTKDRFNKLNNLKVIEYFKVLDESKLVSMNSKAKAGFLKPVDYNATTAGMFSLPDPGWQKALEDYYGAMEKESMVALSAAWVIQPVNGTEPFPGRDAFSKFKKGI
jgi:hypothetical protein